MTVNAKKAIKKFMESQKSKGLTRNTKLSMLNRKLARVEKLANRIRRNRARPEEKEIFENLKKEIGINEVWFNNYTKEWVME